HADKLSALAPLRDLKLTRLGSSSVAASELAACPLLGRLRRLDLSGRLDREELTTLLRSPNLKQLTALALSGGGCPAGGLQPLAECALPCVEELDLSEMLLAGDGMRLLTASRLPFPLRRLNLSSTNLQAQAVEKLARAAGLADLK